jgi:hypothetical protein
MMRAYYKKATECGLVSILLNGGGGKTLPVVGLLQGGRLSILVDEFFVETLVSENKQEIKEVVGLMEGVEVKELLIYARSHK